MTYFLTVLPGKNLFAVMYMKKLFCDIQNFTLFGMSDPLFLIYITNGLIFDANFPKKVCQRYLFGNTPCICHICFRERRCCTNVVNLQVRSFFFEIRSICRASHDIIKTSIWRKFTKCWGSLWSSKEEKMKQWKTK